MRRSNKSPMLQARPWLTAAEGKTGNPNLRERKLAQAKILELWRAYTGCTTTDDGHINSIKRVVNLVPDQTGTNQGG